MHKKNKLNGSKKGTTLIEVLIAASVALVALSITYSAWRAISYNYYLLESHVGARQEVRNASNTIFMDVRNASYMFANRSVTMAGVLYDVANINETGTDMILAIPENADPGNTTYTIVGYYLVKKADAVNVTAHDLMRYEVNGIRPPIADFPISINLANITGGSRRRVASFIDKDKFSFNIRDNGNSIDIRPMARKQEIASQIPIIIEVFMTINIKNK